METGTPNGLRNHAFASSSLAWGTNTEDDAAGMAGDQS
jgi:hypothetical protein